MESKLRARHRRVGVGWGGACALRWGQNDPQDPGLRLGSRKPWVLF